MPVYASGRAVFAVVSAETEKAVELSVHREDAERFLDEVRGDDAEFAITLRLEAVERDAFGVLAAHEKRRRRVRSRRLRRRRRAPA